MKKNRVLLILLAASLCGLSGCSGEDDSFTYSSIVAGPCGDGIQNLGEACDDGNTNNGDGCSSECKVELNCECKDFGQPCECSGKEEPKPENKCGNGVRESGEECDDGNLQNGDGCPVDCSYIEDGYGCPPSGGACWLLNPPEPPPEDDKCGDYELNEGEQCDDGAKDDGDGCSSTCQIEDGWMCPDYSNCVKIGCGDGIKEADEDCDPSIDGSLPVDYDDTYDPEVGNTKCTSNCKFPAFCGDGKVQQEEGEDCDTGLDFVAYDKDYVKSGTHKCTTKCKNAPYCGDGIWQSDFEKCDPSVEGTGVGCNNDCTQKEGYICSAIDGTCVEVHAIKCGDGLVEGSEECEQNGNGCKSCMHADGYKCLGSVTSHCSACEGGQKYSNYPCCTSKSGEQCKNISAGYGDGILDPDGFEECDDGNKKNGDGCSSTGKIESGYVCREAGKACTPICGDGILVGGEECDDGNRKGGDGCSQECVVEDGYVCKNGKNCQLDYCGNKVTGSEEACDGDTGCGSDCHSVKSGYCYSKSKGLHKCSTKSCGNYILEYGEECDDGNTLGGDGCSKDCKVEYAYECTNGLDCRPVCGDGKVMWQIGEKCDLGENNGHGKGCSVKCEIEKGFTCTTPDQNMPNSISLPVVYRDFAGRNFSSGSGLVNTSIYNNLSSSDCRRTMEDSEPASFKSQIKARIPDLVPGQMWLKKNYGYPDFEGFAGNLCFGLVDKKLDSDGKPVFKGNLGDNCCGTMNSTQCSNFYVPDEQHPASYTNGATYKIYQGGTSNTSWHHVSKLKKKNHLLCADSLKKWYRTDSNINAAVSSELKLDKVTGTESKYVFDSKNAPYSGYFSPIDGKGLNDIDPGNNHNGSFTTEISTMFQYTGGETLNFSGDDDVWVFINGNLFLDIGGMHATVEGQNTLSKGVCTSPDKKNGGTAERVCDENYEIYQGGIYELKVFHAERARSGANFKLTLDGFVNPGNVSCTSKCGDGIVAANEECDIKDTSAAEALGCVNCKWTNKCGNGRIEGTEACDTGHLCNTYKAACSALGLSYVANNKCNESSCAYKDKLCGNGILDPGEECDSKNDPKCNQYTCKFYCGDGIVQNGEECDLGSSNNDNGSSGCTSACKVPYCGDGIVSPYAGEVCDDGVNNGTPGEGKCMPGCARKAPYCGDGIVQEGEECDLGKEKNKGGYGGCLANCDRDSYCGDKIIDSEYGEACDDGPNGSSSCTPTCQKPIN